MFDPILNSCEQYVMHFLDNIIFIASLRYLVSQIVYNQGMYVISLILLVESLNYRR